MSARNVLLVSGFAAVLALPVSAMSDEDCCPSGGNGVAPKSLSVLSAAPPVDCCPSGGNGISSDTGFGQSAPNLLNLSSDPAWRAYAFTRNGVRYMQINDGAGHVRAAFATAGGVLMVLPMGHDVVIEVDDVPARTPVYQDGIMTVVPQMLPDGSVQWLVRLMRS